MINPRLLLFIICISILLATCSQKETNIERTIILAQRMNNGDTSRVRHLFADSVQNFFFDSFINTFTVETEVNNVLISGLSEGFYQIDQIIESSDSNVTFTTKEFPGYLSAYTTSVDTIQYQMTYYFKNNKIYKTRTDTLTNMPYCYSCMDKKRDLYLSEYFEWINKTHPKVDSILNDYYSNFIDGRKQDPEKVLKSELLQKEYFKIWEKEKNNR